MVNIRTATEKDLPVMLEIYNDIILNTTAVYDYEPHTLAMRIDWFEAKKAQSFPVFVAEEKGKIGGFSSIGPFRNWAAYKHTVENSVYVASGQRGKGIGKLLLQPLIDAAKKLEMHTIIAGIDSTNDASIILHQRFGFIEVAHFKQVGYKFNKWLDLIFMQLMLT